VADLEEEEAGDEDQRQHCCENGARHRLPVVQSAWLAGLVAFVCVCSVISVANKGGRPTVG
jgi:hypothetical protein